MKSYEVEKLFNSEVREKKRVGRGIYNRASRRGYVGAVRTQVDFLKGKKKKEYMKNGEVKMSNMYEDINNIPSANEIMEMDEEKARKLLIEIKKLHTSTALKNYWKMTNSSSVYHLYYKFGVLEKPKTYRERKDKADRNRLERREKRGRKSINDVVEVVEPIQVVQAVEEGFRVKFNGKYSKEYIDKKITAILMTMEDDKEYNINFDFLEL